MIELFANFIDEVRNHGFEKVFGRYYSVYRAVVVDNTDEENRGRISIKVPALFGSQVLPELAVPKDFSSSGPGKGQFYPPDIDDHVYVEFEMGDANHPIYSGGWFAQNELPTDFAYSPEDTPVVRGYKNKYGQTLSYDETPEKQKVILSTPAGNFIILDDTAGTEGIFLIHKTGAQFQTDAQGNIKILGKDGSFVFIDSENGAVTMTAASGAYATVNANGVTLSEATGQNFISVTDTAVQLISSGDILYNSNSFGVVAGTISMTDSLKSGLKIDKGMVALGSPAAELLTLIGQMIDALLQAPTLVTTGTGPSSPITPPASAQLAIVKSLLQTITLGSVS